MSIIFSCAAGTALVPAIRRAPSERSEMRPERLPASKDCALATSILDSSEPKPLRALAAIANPPSARISLPSASRVMYGSSTCRMSALLMRGSNSWIATSSFASSTSSNVTFQFAPSAPTRPACLS